MIVCSCKAVSDREVRRVVREGADSVREIGRLCGAGTECGSCRVDLQAILAEERAGRVVAAK